jgi:hypothetical protein
MTSNILNSEKADFVSVQIVKAFIKLRQCIIEQTDTNA